MHAAKHVARPKRSSKIQRGVGVSGRDMKVARQLVEKYVTDRGNSSTVAGKRRAAAKGHGVNHAARGKAAVVAKAAFANGETAPRK